MSMVLDRVETVGKSGPAARRLRLDDIPGDTATVEEFCQVMGVNRQAGFAAVREKRVPVLRFGRRIVISKQTIARLLAGEISL
jgi:hypothetical protein